jgi:flagellar motor switch protein FliG
LKRECPLPFDDIVTITDRKLQKILREIDAELLAIALAGSDKQVKSKFFHNMSRRASCLTGVYVV